MRRYTTIKSNVYAPVSTNLLSQSMIHDHMVSHYRKTYFARSQVDTSPPWKYKTRDFYPPDRIRKKVNKFNSVPDKKEEIDSTLEIKSNPLVVCEHHYTMQRQTERKLEFTPQKQRTASESKRKDVWSTKMNIQSDALICENISSVPPLCISSRKQRQNPQFRTINLQTWNKKCVCQDKRKVIYGKPKAVPTDHIKENVPKPPSKSRVHHPLQSHHRNFQDNGVCVSSGSEGNAGDDEDGTPTSSCDDFNQSPRDSQNSPLSIHKVTIAESDLANICKCKRKCILEKGKQNPCLCHVPIKGTKTAGSMASSRDSAYEGGGVMSSTENQRNSPDEFKDESKWYRPCIDANYIEKEEADLLSSKEAVPFSGKSELYMKFLQDVTEDVLVQAAFSNEALKSIFQHHIDNNVYNLEVEHMKLMICKLMDDLGIKSNTCNETERGSKISGEVPLKPRNKWSYEETAVKSVIKNIKATSFTTASAKVTETKEVMSPRTKAEFLCGEKNSYSSLVNIEKNVFMSKAEVMAYLTDMGFEDSLSEEIYQILAGKHSLAQEVPIQSTLQ